jgi:hypothetical protein
LHDPDREGVHVVLDLENDRSTHANEQRARGFAAELLLPRAGLNGLLGLPRWRSRATDRRGAGRGRDGSLRRVGLEPIDPLPWDAPHLVGALACEPHEPVGLAGAQSRRLA